MTAALARERIRIARHSALRNRLIGDGLLEDQADRWISDWAQHVGEPQEADEFDAAYEWIVSELAGGRRTPDAGGLAGGRRTPDAGGLAVTTEPPRGAGVP